MTSVKHIIKIGTVVIVW